MTQTKLEESIIYFLTATGGIFAYLNPFYNGIDVKDFSNLDGIQVVVYLSICDEQALKERILTANKLHYKIKTKTMDEGLKCSNVQMMFKAFKISSYKFQSSN